MNEMLLLIVIYQIKHFLADYPLQTPYMLGKFKDKGWVQPLATHCAVHSLFTIVIASMYAGVGLLASCLALFDFTAHFIMDRIKASPKMLGRYTALTKDDFKEHNDVVSQFTQEIRDLSLSQETLPMAAEVRAGLNTEKLEWHDRLRSNKLFWWSLGFDQMVHHLTHYVIIAVICNSHSLM
jgi:hypothetical protein